MKTANKFRVIEIPDGGFRMLFHVCFNVKYRTAAMVVSEATMHSHTSELNGLKTSQSRARRLGLRDINVKSST